MRVLSNSNRIATSCHHQLRTFCWFAILLSAKGFQQRPFWQASTFVRHQASLRTPTDLLSTTTTLHYANTQPQEQTSSSGNVEQLKELVDIVDVVESYDLPKFHRRGTGAVALCPFHDDNNPSLSIDSSRQYFKCFSCGVGGDVFKFVQDYSKLPGNDPMTFGQVLQLVSTKFGNGQFQLLPDGLSNEERDALRNKKERIILANTFAANFYSKCLTEPFAGGARFHLRSRRISTVTLCRSGLGYAPDCYFGPHKGSSPPGKGGLVEHLQMLNFTASEILDSGLASVRKGTNTTTALEHTMLVDRFRGRLMVPIFDATGKKILAFGGREIKPPSGMDELDSISASSFKVPKYLNSPESLVFEKRNVLFGRSNAVSAAAKSTGPPSLLVVEGYMDAISLWSAGLEMTVATMGTAVTEEQLDAAAKLVAPGQGRVILCLDNDEAGKAATARLCTNGILSTVSKRRKVEFYIAQFPPGVKDPAEFLETYGETTPTSELTNLFTGEVVSKAIEWTEWYVQHLMEQYNPAAARGTAGSFQDVFGRIGSYLASALDPPDRTKAACEVSQRLSTLLAAETNVSEPSQSVRAQLETDLVELSAKLARDKDSFRRRVADATVLPVSQTTESKEVQRLLNGGSSINRKSPTLRRSPRVVIREGAASLFRPQTKTVSATRPSRTKRRIAKLNRQPETESLTPYVNGLRFTNKSDREWAGVSDSKKGKRRKDNLVLGVNEKSWQQNDLVYFNSPAYHGEQFLTTAAEEAGYKRGSMRPDKSVIQHGLASLLWEGAYDVAHLKEAAEDSLLHILVHHQSARTRVKDMLQNTIEKITDGEICWSSNDKEWLFDLLLDEQSMTASGCTTNTTALRVFLANQDGVPPSAFSNEDTVQVGESILVAPDRNATGLTTPANSVGSLDKFFDAIQDDPELPTNVNGGQRTDSAAQKLLVSLFSISKTEKLKELSGRISLQAAGNSQALPTSDFPLNGVASNVTLVSKNGLEDNVLIFAESNMTLPDRNETGRLALSAQQSDAINKFQKAATEAVSWKKAESHINARLVDKNREYGDEGQLPESLQAKVASKARDHWMDMVKGGKQDQAQNDGNPTEGFSAPGDEPFEDGLERLQAEYGDWYNDDYFWTPGDSAKMETPPEAEILTELGDNELALGEESVEEFNERIDREYGHWDLS